MTFIKITKVIRAVNTESDHSHPSFCHIYFVICPINLIIGVGADIFHHSIRLRCRYEFRKKTGS